jgi:cellobiose phosphorylase
MPKVVVWSLKNRMPSDMDQMSFHFLMSDIPISSFPFVASSPAGPRIMLNQNGSIRRIDCEDCLINLFPTNAVEAGPCNVYLRVHRTDAVYVIPLLGPNSPLRWEFLERGMVGEGTWENFRLQMRLLLAESEAVWFWHVRIENLGAENLSCDLIHTQDVGLAHYGAVRLNEYYVSQYIDHLALQHDGHGVCVASRQNQPMGGRFPSLLIGSLGKAVSYATDALSVYGREFRMGEPAIGLREGLPGKRLQHEHSLVALQEEEFSLEPGQFTERGFFAQVVMDHAAALSMDDVRRVDHALALPEAICPPWLVDAPQRSNAGGTFSDARYLPVVDLDDAELEKLFGSQRLQEERSDGQLLSFFTPNHEHVVLRAKEGKVLRPHGHIMRSGAALVPDEASMTSNAWMGGVFHSMVTQGHVSINRFLSTCHTYLGVFRSHGQRVFVEIDDVWLLLGVPSAFCMASNQCRWIYWFSSGVLEVVTTAGEEVHELTLSIRVIAGHKRRFLLSHHVALNGDDGLQTGPVLFEQEENQIVVRAIAESDVGRRFPEGSFVIAWDDDVIWEKVGGDEMLWDDGISRGEPFLCLQSKSTHSVELSMQGHLLTTAALDQGSAGAQDWQLSVDKANPHTQAVSAITEIIPWLVNNAFVHYLSPRGLEQYSGGGWGTRDVCQGPMELLLSLGHFSSARDLLCRVFRQQNRDGDWPQWFMFFERERNIRPGDSHGDIVYWPVLALAEYLCATRDAAILDERLPFFHPEGDEKAETVTIAEHVECALGLMRRRVIDGTVLAAYGHGDWNDSLQPAKPEMRDHLCSSWTVTLNYQTYRTLADAYDRLDRATEAQALREHAAVILQQFQEILVIDGVVTGLLYFHPEGKREAMLHPGDENTGLSYSLLPIIHGIINDMFTPEQAAQHLDILRENLLGPDGARLFDRPMPYQGGISCNFQRAETASFFGREIGIMYMHAHIRYAEALARFGDAPALFLALQQINPIGMQSIVKSAALRQSNCYYSSSDAAFADRYEAYENYDRLQSGDVALEGGWRVYSSGSGIAVRLILQSFLGIRLEEDGVIFDPVIDPALTNLRASVTVAGHRWQVEYRVGVLGCGPIAVTANGQLLIGERLSNPYRRGGLRILHSEWQRITRGQENQLIIELD